MRLSTMRVENIGESARKDGSYRGGCQGTTSNPAVGEGARGAQPSLGLGQGGKPLDWWLLQVGEDLETPWGGLREPSRVPDRLKTCALVILWQRLLCVQTCYILPLDVQVNSISQPLSS